MSLKPATIAHYVNGHGVAGGSARQQAVFNPATGAVTGQVALANAADVHSAVAAAKAAFPAWADTPPIRRARVMFKFLELIQAEYDDLARLLSSERGKTFADSKGDIQRGIEVVGLDDSAFVTVDALPGQMALVECAKGCRESFAEAGIVLPVMVSVRLGGSLADAVWKDELPDAVVAGSRTTEAGTGRP